MAAIVIVDDDPDITELLAVILKADRHETRTAQSGLKALDLVAERPPDLVLMDVEMPGLSGPETVYALFLRNRGDEKIPVVLLSGAVGLPELAAIVGTPYFLGKPYFPDALRRMVARALHERIPPTPRPEASSCN